MTATEPKARERQRGGSPYGQENLPQASLLKSHLPQANFLERFYAFRHMGPKIKGKKVVLAAVGCVHPEQAGDALTKFANFNEFDIIGTVNCKGVLSCLICGNGEICPVSGAKKLYGENIKITLDMAPQWKDLTDVQAKARELGKKLASAL